MSALVTNMKTITLFTDISILKYFRVKGEGKYSNGGLGMWLECSNYHTVALISHASKVMYKILQARLQQFVNWDLPDVQAGFRKAERPEIKLPTSVGLLKKSKRISEKYVYFCFINYAKAFDSVNHNELWKIIKEMQIPHCLTCLLWNLYAGQEATFQNGHRMMDLFKLWKSVGAWYIVTVLI